MAARQRSAEGCQETVSTFGSKTSSWPCWRAERRATEPLEARYPASCHAVGLAVPALSRRVRANPRALPRAQRGGVRVQGRDRTTTGAACPPHCRRLPVAKSAHRGCATNVIVPPGLRSVWGTAAAPTDRATAGHNGFAPGLPAPSTGPHNEHHRCCTRTQTQRAPARGGDTAGGQPVVAVGPRTRSGAPARRHRRSDGSPAACARPAPGSGDGPELPD
jgi:hypothetical protein